MARRERCESRGAAHTIPPTVNAIRRTLALLLCGTVAACTLVKLGTESAAFYEATVLVGRIETPTGWNGPIVVAAHVPTARGIEVAHQTRLHEPGGYELIVPRGSYALFAFADANGNGSYDADEPAGEYAGGKPVAASGTGVVALLDFVVVHPPYAPTAVPPGTRFAAAGPRGHSTQVGALADLDAPQFSAASGTRGYWAPMESFRDVGGNVYFTEPYDPQRIPVLFVHGAAGSAQDWRHFVEHLDRGRYQAWLYQYPSGASVDSMAYLLYWKLLNLQLRYRYDTLVVTAHSMGGLVARRFLLDHGRQFPQIRLFVSLSTPWGGEELAAAGVRHSPAVVPSWNDMQPQGRFMQALFAQPLPRQVGYYLLFGHRGGGSLLRPNNDGTVTLASQLRGPAQSEARRVFGFDEDHASILSSPAVLAQYRSILDGYAGSAGAASAGRVHVVFEFADRSDTARGSPALLLRRIGSGGRVTNEAITIDLSADDSGRSIGPVPFGDYDASLAAIAYRSEPRRTRVRVAADATPTLSFRLVPQGSLSGYVGADAAAGQYPAGSYRPPHPSVLVRSVALAGPVSRSLVPRQSGNDDLLERYLDGVDAAFKAGFSFVDLPAGDYELVIVADGYQPHRSRHTVVPGRAAPLEPIVLERAGSATARGSAELK